MLMRHGELRDRREADRVPRESRKKQEIDVSRFAPLVAEALKAFGTHVAYAEAMSRAAVTIERKRAVWKTRTNVAKAEETARKKCEKRKFICEVDNPCGTGRCRFAPADLAGIELTASGKKARPANSVKGPYDSEVVVRFIQDQRPSSLVRPRDDEGS